MRFSDAELGAIEQAIPGLAASCLIQSVARPTQYYIGITCNLGTTLGQAAEIARLTSGE